VGSGIKIIGAADNFYGAREGAALPLKSHLTLTLTLSFDFNVLISKNN
jgi:hypothetical protein